MADETGGLDGKDICTAILNVNGVVVSAIKGISGKDKKECCVANGPIKLSKPQESCAAACVYEGCEDFYTDGNAGTCPLVAGDHLWVNESCGCADTGYYSPKTCDGGCDYCYYVPEEGCKILVTTCPTVCNAITFHYKDRDCRSACGEGDCTEFYINASVTCPLAIGVKIYLDSSCEECAPTGYYSQKDCEGPECTLCYTYTDCAITRIEDCR